MSIALTTIQDEQGGIISRRLGGGGIGSKGVTLKDGYMRIFRTHGERAPLKRDRNVIYLFHNRC